VRPTISAAFIQEAKARESGETVIILVTIDHEDLPEPIRLNTAGANITSRSELYLACFLQITLLDDSPDRAPQAQMIVSNIDRTMVAALRATLVPPTVTLEIVRASAPDYVEASITNLEMRIVNYDAIAIQGNLTPGKIRTQPAIDYTYNPSYFPGLF